MAKAIPATLEAHSAGEAEEEAEDEAEDEDNKQMRISTIAHHIITMAKAIKSTIRIRQSTPINIGTRAMTKPMEQGAGVEETEDEAKNSAEIAVEYADGAEV
ncbi:hypothetical protein BGZ51_003643 [Haplosporangium sp. Z 767]|nr:hypothetical protein BGZ51_003643 [Haplosporangium sp. Z 767]KAF9188585.1 hypothetical protein BGZ50_001238 [Haplosporangium sp. Z 11]